MALHWRPVGPEPASTYWQRRAVAATAVVLLLALLSALLTGGSDDRDTLAEAGPSASPSAPPTAATVTPSATPSPSATPRPSPATACAPAALKVEALAGEQSYPVGGSPRLTLRITNTGATPCTRDLGQAALELLVLSGRDRIWSSDDCAPGGEADPTTLAPGEPVLKASTWNGRRSRPGCAGEKAQAQPGTYRVQGRVGDQVVQGDVFVLKG